MTEMSSEAKWSKEFATLDKLARAELKDLQTKVNDALEKVDRGIADQGFLASLKETIDKATQMNQIYGVLRYTARWNNATNRTTSQGNPSSPGS